jgi:septum site-determining protein MinC
MSDGDARAADASAGIGQLFGTETMAELFVRQGQLAEAIGIYRSLLASRPSPEQRARWSLRLEALDRVRVDAAPDGLQPAELPRPGTGLERRRKTQEIPAPGPLRPPLPPHTLPLVIREPVRSGQVVYAERNDLIVLAPVHSGAQLIADGNIHVYAPLRGRAFAGAQGASQARIFCLRLEAELVAINDAYVLYDDIPPDRRIRPVQVHVKDGRCVIDPLL